ncbi:hypothetical protein ACQJBY_068464 [Aegilops geniculata]
MLDPAGAEPFARAYAGVPAYAYYDQDREANEVMLDDEHRLEDILVGDAPLRQHLQRMVKPEVMHILRVIVQTVHGTHMP